jgi:hypothetical protein
MILALSGQPPVLQLIAIRVKVLGIGKQLSTAQCNLKNALGIIACLDINLWTAAGWIWLFPLPGKNFTKTEEQVPVPTGKKMKSCLLLKCTVGLVIAVAAQNTVISLCCGTMNLLLNIPMNKKTLKLIIFLISLVGFLLFLRLWSTKKQQVPYQPGITPTPKKQFTSTPTTNPFLSFPPPETPFITLAPLTPTRTLTQRPTQKPTLIPTSDPVTKRKAINLLPISTSGYTIEYLSTSDKFFVSIINTPIEQNLKEAETWFQSHGINPQDPSIVWNITRRYNPKTQ